MKYLFICLCLFISTLTFAQSDDSLAFMNFVEILNDNKEEAIYYYENNWKVLRDQAIERGFISSYQLLEVPYSEEAPFHIILVTSFATQEQYDAVEENFEILISERGERRLLNDKMPSEFRRIIFSKDNVKYLH